MIGTSFIDQSIPDICPENWKVVPQSSAPIFISFLSETLSEDAENKRQGVSGKKMNTIMALGNEKKHKMVMIARTTNLRPWLDVLVLVGTKAGELVDFTTIAASNGN